MSCVWQVGWPTFVLLGKDFYVGHYMQTFQPFVFTPAFIFAPLYLNHFHWPWYLGWGSRGQRKAQPIVFIFSHTFSTDHDEIWCVLWRTPWYSFGVRFNETMEIMIVLLTASKTNAGMHVYDLLWVKLGIYDDRYHWTRHLDTILTDLDLDSRSK